MLTFLGQFEHKIKDYMYTDKNIATWMKQYLLEIVFLT